MTNEDYLEWLLSLAEYNEKRAGEAEEYRVSGMAYRKAYDVFKKDVMGGKEE